MDGWVESSCRPSVAEFSDGDDVGENKDNK